MGMDLPLKALVWQDAQGQVWLGYNNPAWIAKRHEVASCPSAAGLAACAGAASRVSRTKASTATSTTAAVMPCARLRQERRQFIGS